MIPEENRSSLDRLRKQPAKLREAVETAAILTAWSQLRGGRAAEAVADPKPDKWSELAEWSAGAAIDAVLAAAARYADLTNREHAAFQQAVREMGGVARCVGRSAAEREKAQA
jgi:hypothetical protein